jgi:RHS repeat-associated protein
VLFTYDQQRQVRSVVYPGGRTIAYGYHGNGKLASIDGVIASIEYDAGGKRKLVTFANGLVTRLDRSAGDELLRRLVTQSADGATRYQDLTYHLDAVGQVLAIDDAADVAGKIRNNQTFAYDRRHRLIHATGRGAGGNWDYRYGYDDVGNLIRFDESFSEPLDYGDAVSPNRLIKRRSAARPEYAYDASGNLTRDPAVGTFAYDARDRLVRIARTDGQVVEYTYDHRGRRCLTRVTDGANVSVRMEVEGIHLVEEGRSIDIVQDDDRRLALLPLAGDGLLHHFDRLGNVNVVSNLRTGAFAGHNEYTPYGQLSVSITIAPHFGFQGNRTSDGLDLVFMGARYYRPALGRFLTADRYLLTEQDKIPSLLAGTNMYLYSLANPVNFIDPTGQIAFLVVLLVAVIVGAALGAIGAALNGAQTWDEWLLWIVGGAIGGALVALGGYGIAIWIFGASAAVAATAAAWVVGIWAVVSLLGSVLTPILDDTNSEVAWFFSFLLKWFNSPITTTIGLIAALIVAIAGGNVDFRRGMLFIEIGPGGGALTLGAVAWTQSGRFDASGNVPDALARHEAHHSRTVVALGELGFYVTYVTFGAIWGAAEGGSWNDLNGIGCGNPFEKTAHTFTGDPAVARPTHQC